MRKSFLLILLFSSVFINVHAQDPSKVALIIAISKYPAASGWGELSSNNDVKLIKDALMRQGFKEQNITVLTDKQATLVGMTNAIDKDLIEKVKPGDIAVLHFSGHGQQIEDDNGDEGDGLDESIIPYDANIEYHPGPDKHFRDDLLGKKLAETRMKLGANGNLLVVIDACHSGTMTRGVGKTRGTNQVYASPAFKTKTGMARTISDDSYGIINETKGMAPMACFFASSPSEQNEEAVLPDGSGAGSLSLAFSRALSKADKNTSYRALFDNIKVEMSSLVSRQTPMAEGELDNTLFGGKALGKPKYYTITKDDKAKTLSIPVGKIYGVFEGTTLKLFKPDTRDTANASPIARATITDAGEYSSEIKLDKTITDDELKTAWVYMDAVNYGDLGVKIKTNIADEGLKKKMEGVFSKIKQATIDNDAADLFLQSGSSIYSADSIYLVNAGEMVIWSAPKGMEEQKMFENISMKIGDYARSKYLRNLALTNPVYKVSFEFVPLKCVSDCGTHNARYMDNKIRTKSDASGNIFFKDGDRFRLNIINNSDQKRLYYTVLDIQPDNVVNVLIPGTKDAPEDFFISQQDTIRLDKIFVIGPPYGIDVLKIIASEAPLDLRYIFESRGAQTRGAPKGPFENILQGTYNAEGTHTRGPKQVAIQPDAVNIITVPYHIIKNE
ncbi:MAG: caspase family protein [Chitinophagaceae bacterium]|nr:caspase family protein [Chitinophagaceae bacterium]